MKEITIPFKRLHDDAVIPTFGTALAAGFDLYAVEDVIISPNETALIPLGFAVAIPEGYEMQIRPRSGVSFKTKLRVANSPATIDADYRGEVKVLLENTEPYTDCLCDGVIGTIGSEIIENDAYRKLEEGTYIIRKGDRIAQGVIAEVPRVRFELVGELDETTRGAGGFGHTGTN